MYEMYQAKYRKVLCELRVGGKRSIRTPFSAAIPSAESGAISTASTDAGVATAIFSAATAICPTANAARFGAKIGRTAKFADRRLCFRCFCFRNWIYCMGCSFRCARFGKSYPDFDWLGRFVDYCHKYRFGCEKNMENQKINQNNRRGDEC